MTRRLFPSPIAALAAVLALAAGASLKADDVLTLGRISDDPRNHYAQLQPLLDYVVPRMREVGIRRGRILMARDARQMANYLRRGSVDWVTETPSMALELQTLAGARPLALTERNGVRAYSSYVVVRRDSGIESLSGLVGGSIAFEHTASTSAYLVPAIAMLAQGLRLEPLTALGDPPQSDSIGYLFARSEANTAIWVAKGLVTAGAMSSLGWENPRTVPESIRAEIAVIHRSEPFPRGLELVRGDLEDRLSRRLQQLLLAAAEDPEAAPALARYFGTTAFLPLEPAVERRLDELRAGLVRVHRDVE